MERTLNPEQEKQSKVALKKAHQIFTKEIEKQRH